VLEAIVFFIATLGLLYISRAALRAPASHGFYRFFAWESLLFLFLLNVRSWFFRPFSPNQIVSWSLLLVSLYLVVQGAALLRRRGRPGGERQVFLGWGIFFKQPSLRGGLFALVASIFLWATARVEEGENVRYFGEAYHEYMKQTKMFVPLVL
jgi:hypothetical protein